MKILKHLFFIILILFIGGSIYFGSQDSAYHIKDTRIIQAPISVIFNKINDYNTWKYWMHWEKEDSILAFQNSEKKKDDLGFYEWRGLKGGGAVKTINVIPNTEISQNLTLYTSRGERSLNLKWGFEKLDDSTQVTWSTDGEHSLMDKLFYAFSDTNFEDNMHQMNNKSFDDIEVLIQDAMEEFSISVNGVTDYSGGYYLYKTTSSTLKNIATTIANQYGVIGDFMKQHNISFSGMPFTIYHEMNIENQSVIISSGAPVKERVIVPDNSEVLCGLLPHTKVLKTTLKGNYTNLSKAWETAFKYIETHDLTQSELKPFEVYENDPGNFPNPAHWITHLYIPVN